MSAATPPPRFHNVSAHAPSRHACIPHPLLSAPSRHACIPQPFFWSAAGTKLFGGHPDLADAAKLRAIVDSAIEQQPQIVLAFLQRASDKAFAAGAAASLKAELAAFVSVSLAALLDYVGKQVTAMHAFTGLARRGGHGQT